MAVRVKSHSESALTLLLPGLLLSSCSSLIFPWKPHSVCAFLCPFPSPLQEEHPVQKEFLKFPLGNGWCGGFPSLELRPPVIPPGRQWRGLCWPWLCWPSKSHAGSTAWEPPGLGTKNLKSKKMVFKCFFCLKMCSWLSLYLSLLFSFS